MAEKKGGAAGGSPGADSKVPLPEIPPIKSNTQDKSRAKRRARKARARARKRQKASEEEQHQGDITTPVTGNGITAGQPSTHVSDKPGVGNLQPCEPNPRSNIQREKEGAFARLPVGDLDMGAEGPEPRDTNVDTVDQATQTIKTWPKGIDARNATTQTEEQKPEWRPKSKKRKRGEDPSPPSSETEGSSSTAGYWESDEDDESSSWGEWDDWEPGYDALERWFDDPRAEGYWEYETSDEGDDFN